MKNRKYNINDSYFNKIDTERKAYILGLLYADGCVYSNSGYSKWAKLDLKYNDVALLKTIAEEMNNECPIKRHIYERNEFFKYQNRDYTFTRDMCRLSFRSDQIVDDLIKLGCPPRKTFKIIFPSEEIVPNNLINHFLRGYLDGDGSISSSVRKSKSKFRKNYMHFQITFTGTSAFINKTKEYLNKNVVKFIGDIHSRWDNGHDNYTLLIDGNNIVEKILDWLYEGSTIYLERKYQKYLLLKEEISNKQKSMDYSYKNRNSVCNEAFNIYKFGEYIGTCDNRRKLERESKSILGEHISRTSFTQCLYHERCEYHGYTFVFVNEDNVIENPIYICCGKNSSSKGKKIEQYDLDENFIKTWYSTKEISNTLDISLKQTSSILSCCKGNQKTAFGYIWKYSS